MRGQITEYLGGSGGGTIVGDDGTTYRFDVSSIRSPGALSAGQRVDFVPANGIATEVFGLDERAPISISATGKGGGQGNFDLGRVIERTFKTIMQNWATFLVASLVLIGVPSLLQVYGQSVMLFQQNVTGMAYTGAGWITWIIGTYILQGMVVKIAVAGFNGKTMTPGDALTAGVKLFLPLLGLGIIIGLGTFLGAILLIVPGIILAVMWSAATGALVVEQQGIFASLQRSRDLTRGYRWQIFGLGVLLVIVSFIIGMLFGGIGAAAGGDFTSGSPNLILNMATTAISNILSAVIGAAGAAALYSELRAAKEGIAPDQLASLFD